MTTTPSLRVLREKPQKPRSLRDASDALQTIRDGLSEAACDARPRDLENLMADSDLRWDQLTDRAVAAILPQVAELLDAAIAAEWEREPVAL